MKSIIDEYKTVGARLAAYKRWQTECSYVAAGIGALLVLAGLASDSFKGAPTGLLAALITLAILSGPCVGRARMGIGWAENDLAGKNIALANEVPAVHKSPTTDRRFMYAGLTFLLCMGGLLVVAAWWTVVAPHDAGCTLKWQANPQAVVCTQ